VYFNLEALGDVTIRSSRIQKVEALYGQPAQLPADDEGSEMRRLRAEINRRMLGWRPFVCAKDQRVRRRSSSARLPLRYRAARHRLSGVAFTLACDRRTCWRRRG
jgi:hypothetical protein